MDDRFAGMQVPYSGTSIHKGNNIESNTNNYFFGKMDVGGERYEDYADVSVEVD